MYASITQGKKITHILTLTTQSDNSDIVDTSSTFDDRTTIVSSIKNYKYENGRRYHSFRDGEYLLPNDEREQERLDLLHHTFRLLLNGELYRAPLSNPVRVLDFGTGTGVWAIDFAEENPRTEVLGTDLSQFNPRGFRQTVGLKLMMSRVNGCTDINPLTTSTAGA